MDLHEQMMETPHGNVAYWVGGSADSAGPALVFLHGLTADHTMFAAQVEAFAPTYRVVLWDAPGHGASRPCKPVSMEEAAADMVAILKHESIERAVLVGQSLGGMIAQHVAIAAPGVVAGIVGVDTSPINVRRFCSKTDRWLLRQTGWMAHICTYQGYLRSVPDRSAVTQAGRDNMRQMLSVYTKPELCELMGAYYRSIAGYRGDGRVSCPVLLLAGDDDRVGKVWEYNEAWSKAEHYPLAVIKDAGHNSNVDNPDAVNRHIRRFLEELGE